MFQIIQINPTKHKNFNASNYPKQSKKSPHNDAIRSFTCTTQTNQKQSKKGKKTKEQLRACAYRVCNGSADPFRPPGTFQSTW
jgi:hypothetical protein